MRGSRVCGKEKWKRIGVAHWGPSGKRAARCGKCSVAWFMAIMMMMMRLRCTEKLQLIVYADPPPTPSPCCPASLSLFPATPTAPPIRRVCPFTPSSETHIQLCCDKPFHRLIYWSIECDESDSSLFKSIRVYSSLFTMPASAWTNAASGDWRKACSIDNDSDYIN